MKTGKTNLIYFEKIDSTQKYLLENLQNIELPVCIWSDYQTNGIGSRGNSWIGKKGNLFFSFADYVSRYPDVPMQSMSIYFGWIMKKTLNDLGSGALMKWPNDIYIKNRKIGGVITTVKKDVFICGIGLNTFFAPDGFLSLDIEIKNDKILKSFFEKLNRAPAFNDVMHEYKKEFEKTKNIFHIDGELQEDGALIKNKKKVYSNR